MSRRSKSPPPVRAARKDIGDNDELSHSEGHVTEHKLRHTVNTVLLGKGRVTNIDQMSEIVALMRTTELSHEGRMILLNVLLTVSQPKLLRLVIEQRGLVTLNGWLRPDPNDVCEASLCGSILTFLERLPITAGSVVVTESGLLATLTALAGQGPGLEASQAGALKESWTVGEDSPSPPPAEPDQPVQMQTIDDDSLKRRRAPVSFGGGRAVKKSRSVASGRKKKSVSWRPQATLARIKEFYKDDIVAEPSTDLSYIAPAQSSLRDDMEAAIAWRLPLRLVHQVKQEPRGLQSTERGVQELREKTIVAVIYLQQSDVPISPAEADVEPVDPTHIVKTIPIDTKRVAQPAPIVSVAPVLDNAQMLNSLLSNPDLLKNPSLLTGLLQQTQQVAQQQQQQQQRQQAPPPVQRVNNNDNWSLPQQHRPNNSYNNNNGPPPQQQYQQNRSQGYNQQQGGQQQQQQQQQRTHQAWKEKTKHCVFFGSSTGCRKAAACPFIHDPSVRGSGNLQQRQFARVGNNGLEAQWTQTRPGVVTYNNNNNNNRQQRPNNNNNNNNSNPNSSWTQPPPQQRHNNYRSQPQNSYNNNNNNNNNYRR